MSAKRIDLIRPLAGRVVTLPAALSAAVVLPALSTVRNRYVAREIERTKQLLYAS